MHIFPQLDIDCPTCHKHKMTKTVPSSRGASKMKNITTVVCNQIQTSTNMQNVKPKLFNHTSSSKEYQNLMYKSDLIDFRSKSLLQ